MVFNIKYCRFASRLDPEPTALQVPTCENMWGVLIFLRFYFVVGQAGPQCEICEPLHLWKPEIQHLKTALVD